MVSQQIIDIIIKAQDEASQVADKVDSSLEKIGDTSSKLSRIPGLDNLKSKLGNVASTIKDKFGGAVDGVRSKLQSLSNGAKGLESAMGFLKGAVSMTAGMIGFELVNGFVEAGRAALNASSQLDYFGQRLGMTQEQTSQFRTELDELQKKYRKVDMTAVGATAEEIAVKTGLPVENIGKLTEMTAVLSSTFVKEGRSQEDAVLAVGDALDGQFKRLQEIGITQEDLKNNGWSGSLEDQTGLIDAMNKTLDQKGFAQTAQDITSLDEAFGALSVAGGQLLADILIPLTPTLIAIMEAVMGAMDAIKPFISTLQDSVDALPDWLKDAGWAALLGAGLYVLGTVIMSTVVPALAAAALAAIDFAIAMLMNPWTYVLLAIVAIAYAIYELGKAFGWWDDVSGMWEAFLNNILMPIWNFLVSVFTPAWNFLMEVIAAITPFVNNVTTAFSGFMSGQLDLPGLILTVMSSILNIYGTIWSMILTLLAQWGSQMLSKGRAYVTQFVNGIVSWLKALPGKVYSVLLGVVSRITGAIQAWVSAASSQVSSVVSAITSPFHGVAGAISGALGGVVGAITAPFKRAWENLKPLVDKIKGAMKIVQGGWGGEEANGRESLLLGAGNKGYTVDNSPVKVEQTLTLDFQNVPSHISTSQLISALTDRNVLDALTSNTDFQTMDNRVKQRILLKNNRAGGI